MHIPKAYPTSARLTSGTPRKKSEAKSRPVSRENANWKQNLCPLWRQPAYTGQVGREGGLKQGRKERHHGTHWRQREVEHTRKDDKSWDSPRGGSVFFGRGGGVIAKELKKWKIWVITIDVTLLKLQPSVVWGNQLTLLKSPPSVISLQFNLHTML